MLLSCSYNSYKISIVNNNAMHCVLLVVERKMVRQNSSVIKVCGGVVHILHEVFKRRAGLEYIYGLDYYCIPN